MRVGVVKFGRNAMNHHGGMDRESFGKMINALPKNSRIVGFSESIVDLSCNIFVTHDSFKDTPESGYLPQIIVFFSRQPDGSEQFDHLDFSGVIENVNNCFPDWEEYVGLVETFRYCKKCGKKEGQHA